MTRMDLVDAVYQKSGFSRKESADLVETVFEIVKENLSEGDPMKLTGFGNFTVRSKNPRPGRNPKTGEEIEITARKVVTFKPSQILRNKVDSGK
ncbi:MAG: integration host factor subunit alpha [Magnetococcales bacterium]|nr:integration host factor subunit alpha [Magnetococcales bacterium]